MRARHRYIAALTMFSGGLVAAVVLSAGCGGKSEDTPTETDTGAPDTGISIVKDSGSPADTGTAMVDSSESWDVPGSLFDADIPDIVFEGGTTAKGCYDCTTTQCKDSVAKCDKDERCRGLLLCVVTTCSSFSDLGCAAGCAFSFGVSDFSDPIVKTLQEIASCNQMNCSGSCPAVDAGMGTKDSGTKTETGTAEAGSAETGAAETGGSGFAPKLPKSPEMSVDPRVVEVLQSVIGSFNDTPEASKGLVDHLSAH